MGRTLFWSLLLTWSNSYAWYCTYTPTDEGYITEGSTQCYGIDVDTAIETVWCTAYQPDDPICDVYATCLDQTEQRTTTCTQPNTSGHVNEARHYTCTTDSWSAWTVSSSHCVDDPATCIEAVEERTVECEPGYQGSSLEQRLTTCSTPYSDPIKSSWTTISTSCTLSVSDPVSPTSITNPVSPVKDLVTPPPDPIGNTSTNSQPKTEDPIQKEVVMPTVEVETETEEKIETEPEAPETQENEEIVPGFGIAIKLIQQSNDALYQQPTEIFLGQTQDDYAAEQNILFNFIQSDDIGDRFDSIARHRWYQLHGHQPLQRYGFGD